MFAARVRQYLETSLARSATASRVRRCQGQDSNLHVLRHQILSLARLPISPP